MLKSLLAMLSVVAGMSPDSFSFQNPVATNPGYFMIKLGLWLLAGLMLAQGLVDALGAPREGKP